MDDKDEQCNNVTKRCPNIGSRGIDIACRYGSTRKAWIINPENGDQALHSYRDAPGAKDWMEKNQCAACGSIQLSARNTVGTDSFDVRGRNKIFVQRTGAATRSVSPRAASGCPSLPDSVRCERTERLVDRTIRPRFRRYALIKVPHSETTAKTVQQRGVDHSPFCAGRLGGGDLPGWNAQRQ